MDLSPLVLVAEDDRERRERLRTTFSEEGFRVLEAASGPQVVAQASQHMPDLVVLTSPLRRMGGVELTARLRKRSAAPIVIMAGSDDDLDRVAALVAGANDYVSRSIEPHELLARLRVWLRHAERVGARGQVRMLEVGELRIDFTRHKAYRGDSEVSLTKLQFRLFAALMRNAGRLMTREQLALAVWGPSREERVIYLRVYIGQLRKRFERDSVPCPYFVAVPGIGYRLRVD
jgi:two-component system KDP operon response regulator KdpE